MIETPQTNIIRGVSFLLKEIKVQDRIEAFEKRMKEEPEFCQDLFTYATLRLMAAKYAYYILGESFIKDDAYDAEENSWFVMGRALGHIIETEKTDKVTPCVGWDENHPLANDSKELALLLIAGGN